MIQPIQQLVMWGTNWWGTKIRGTAVAGRVYSGRAAIGLDNQTEEGKSSHTVASG